MDGYVLVPPEDAQLLTELKEVSVKGHSADGVRYVERDKEWVFFENSKKRRSIKKREGSAE